MVRLAGLEPATPGLEGRCSIRLSYGRKLRGCWDTSPTGTTTSTAKTTGRGGGIRTHDPLLPKQMRYQAALRPETCPNNWDGVLATRRLAEQCA